MINIKVKYTADPQLDDVSSQFLNLENQESESLNLSGYVILDPKLRKSEIRIHAMIKIFLNHIFSSKANPTNNRYSFKTIKISLSPQNSSKF